VTNSQKGKNPLVLLYSTRGRIILLPSRKIILPQIGKDVPHLETTIGKGFQGFFEEKMDSTFSTRMRSRVTQLGIV